MTYFLYTALQVEPGKFARTMSPERVTTMAQAISKARSLSNSHGIIDIFCPPDDAPDKASLGLVVIIDEQDPHLRVPYVDPQFLPKPLREELQTTVGTAWYDMYVEDLNDTARALAFEGFGGRGVECLVDQELVAEFEAMYYQGWTSAAALALAVAPYAICSQCRQAGHFHDTCTNKSAEA